MHRRQHLWLRGTGLTRPLLSMPVDGATFSLSRQNISGIVHPQKMRTRHELA